MTYFRKYGYVFGRPPMAWYRPILCALGAHFKISFYRKRQQRRGFEGAKAATGWECYFCSKRKITS